MNQTGRPSRAAPGARRQTSKPEPRGALAGPELAACLDGILSGAASLTERLEAIAGVIEGRVAFSTSLGLEDQALLDAIAATGFEFDIFTLDTGRHFPETLELLEASELRYGRKIRVIFPEAREVEELVARDGIMGFRASVEARKACCEIRKVRPLTKALAGAQGWITGIRRDQSMGRSSVPFATWDSVHGLVKLNPIADWTLEQLQSYVAERAVPVSALHAKGYPSIGCQPCTRAVRPGEDIRAGRWWWENEDGKECGLHNRPKPKGAAA